MKPLTKRIHDFDRHWFGSASELCQREETPTPSIMLLGCPDHGMLPHGLPVQNPMSFLVAQWLGFAIPPFTKRCSETVETLEEAVLGHEVTDFIVCSHTNCGICQNWLAAPSNSKKAIGRETITPTLEFIDKHYDDVFDMERFGLLLREHVLLQLESLIEYHFVRSRLNDGRMKLHGWVFDEGTRRIRAYDALVGDFVSVETDACAPVTT